MVVLAIDPGASGGMAWTDGGVHCRKMPDTEGDIISTLKEIRPTLIVIEEVGGFVKGKPGGGQPGSAMFKFGRNFGFLLGASQMMGCEVRLIRPQVWTKAVGAGTKSGCATTTIWKNKLKAIAQRIYPSLKVTLAVSDALLILEYGLNQNHHGIQKTPDR